MVVVVLLLGFEVYGRDDGSIITCVCRYKNIEIDGYQKVDRTTGNVMLHLRESIIFQVSARY